MKHPLRTLLALLALPTLPALPAFSQDTPPAAPSAEPPQTLRDANGAPETDLVDPFKRRVSLESDEDGPDGLLRTSFGEISDEFRILSIIVPQDTNTPPMALIKLNARSEPQLVRPNDLVRIDRGSILGVARAPAVRRAAAARPAGALTSAELETLDRYTFYLRVKEIQQTYIEVFHNKKRPDETIILSW